MPCGPHITLLHTLEYGHLDRTSDHPAQGVRAPSTPRPVAHCSGRSDLRALAHQQNSDLLHTISFEGSSLPAEDRHVAYVARPIHYRPHELLRLRPKAPRNLYTKWDKFRPLRKISMCTHRVVPPSPLVPLTVAGELARGVRTDCTAIIIMEVLNFKTGCF